MDEAIDVIARATPDGYLAHKLSCASATFHDTHHHELT